MKITSEDSLFNIYRKGNCMIFVKEKNVTRSPVLSNWIQQVHHEKVGNFYLIHPDDSLVPGSFGQVNISTVSN